MWAVPLVGTGVGALIETTFDSADFPAAERFDRWRHLASRSLAPTDIGAEDPERFRATMRHIDLGAVQVAAMSYPSLHCRRTPRMIRRFDPEYLNVGLIVQGAQAITLADRTTLAGPGDLVLYDTSHAYAAEVIPQAPRAAETIVAQFPRSLLPERTFVEALGERVAGDRGAGALPAQFLAALVRDADHYAPADGPRLAAVFLDLMSIALTSGRDAGREAPTRDHETVLMLRIHAHIQQRLADQQLSPVTIAAAHCISVRHLHRLFENQGRTVAAWILHERLARCRRDLADPRLRTRPIHAIALRWGFPRAADFTRAFRRIHGVTPSEYRRSADDHLCAQSQGVVTEG
ncbi:helix-turn-helix domain-containing protein [Yinghuangia aomiensis]|uniref:Helix-turn-helix domain-containing protein n=1 Tax=Yinghuangia aomiensis TaxID=676205 RepID=A0ABP9IJ24_9ACTN